MKDRMWIGFVLIIITSFLLVTFIDVPFAGKHIHEKRSDFINLKDSIIKEQIVKGDYACCLEKPCMYCIEKTPGHGEGAKCSCLEDVLTGKHPCGECIGEILEGHGNKFLSKYFASAIAEKTGHLDILKQIILEKYGMPIEDQV